MNYLGIRGFESVLRGGIPARAEVLLLTPEGPERFLLGAHWVLEGLSRGERVLAVLSGESPDAFVARLGRMGVDAASAIASGSLTIVDWYTCWTQPVEGMEEVHRMFRASRKVEDLLAAVDRAIPVLAPATDRRAFVDVLPLALKALDEAGATEALKVLRSRLSEAGVTAVFAADRALPEARRDVLFPTFHAVLDARGEERDVLAFAVLAVGGVKLAGRYRRARVREDGASVETTPTVRTFSCPICDARVPFDAAKCPSCGTLRAQMSVGTRESGLMDYVETLGREGGVPGARPRPARESRAPGLTNGVRAPRPGRVNGVSPGRVNGTVPKGKTNGLAPAGRTNGLQTGPGRTNGLVNGLARARSGMTNGLTNGSGFTNGLGGPRARHEAHRARWKLFFVPFLAVLLLMTPFLLSDTGSPPGYAADGDFSEWSRVVGNEQQPVPGTNPAVALTGFKLIVEAEALALYATVAGTWFEDAEDVHALYAFIDPDRVPGSGYEVPGLSAEFLVAVEGSGRTIHGASYRVFTGEDPHNWSAWRSEGPASAAVSGNALEVVVPWERAAYPNPLVLLVADDGRGDRSYSAVAFGEEPGALRARVVPRESIAARGTPQVLDVEFEAFGSPVEVTDLMINVAGGVTLEPLGLPVTVLPGQQPPPTIPVRLNTASAATGTLVTVELRAVTTAGDRPVLLGERVVRAYVESAPSGKVVDGWFGDWGPELSTDADPRPLDADRDLDQYAANRTGGTLYLYADVKGTMLAGSPVPVRRTRPTPGGGPSPAPGGQPVRTSGEDMFRVYVDTDRDVPDGVPVSGLRGADLLLQVRGSYGRVTQRAAFAWSNGWTPIALPQTENADRRLEASLPVPLQGAIEFVLETTGWQGPADTTAPTATRGVRSVGDGTLRSEGRFQASFSPDGRVDLGARGVRFGWSLPSLGGPLGWSLAPTPTGVRFGTANAEVRYAMSDLQLKEEFVLFARPEGLQALEFPFNLSPGVFLWVEDGGPIGVQTGQARAFEVAVPFAVDARGRVTPLSLEADTEARVLRVPLPRDLMETAAYPLVIDPVVNYTLENDGASNDPGENLGYSVAIGDFNGDNRADVLTGAPFNNLGGSSNNHGYSYVYYGPFSADETTPDVWINGTMASAQFGYSVAAGKFNGDQYWDALISRRAVVGIPGNVSIYYGSASWSGLETTPDVNFTPPASPQNFGWAVAAGNLNDAGYDEVLIAEPARDNDGGLASQDGVVHVYVSPFSAAESTADFTLFPSTNTSGWFGWSLAVGKVDGDAYPDIVVGEPLYNSNDGRVQFHKGIGLASGSGNRYPNATLSMPPAGGVGEFGKAVSVGKVNGDSYADVVVGALRKSTYDGSAYLYLANSGGSGLTTGASPSATLASQSADERFGSAVLVVDFDDDGAGGILVGAPYATVGGVAERGRAYWFDSPDTDQTVDLTWWGGQNPGERLGNALAGGKFPSDTNTLIAVGAYLWDDGSETNSGRIVVAIVPELPYFMVLVALVPWLRARRRARRRGAPR